AKDAKQVIGLNALELSTYKAVGLDKFFREGLQGKPFMTEVEYTSYTGKKTTYRHYFGVPIFGIDGKTVERLLLMVEDVSERKKLEKELEKYTEKLEQIVLQRTAQLEERVAELARINKLLEEEGSKLQTTLESIGDGVFAINKTRRIVFFNKIAEELTGFSGQEAIGRPYTEIVKFVLESDLLPNYSFIEDTFTTGRINHIRNHTFLISKSGEKIPILDSAAPIKRGESGEIFGAIVVFRDIAREYQIDKAKTEFISLASHQLRTPLTAIRWISDILLGQDIGALNNKQKEFLQDLSQSVIRMSDLINDLLNISRIESAQLEIKLKEVDIEKLYGKIVKELESLIKEKEHVLTLENPENVRFIKTDGNILSEILENLLSNAVK
ncbi:MAG: PAS domain-containing protein, partial [Patescibacteria group bacterium]